MADFQTRVVTSALITLAVGGALAWLQRRSARADAAVDVDARQLVLRYGSLFRIALPWSCAAFAAVGAVVIVFTWPDDPKPALSGAFLCAFFGIGAISCAIATRAQVRYDAERVIGGRPGKPVEIAWADVKRVTYSALWHGIVLHAPGGRRITVGLYMHGATAFLDALRRQVEGKRRRDFEDALAKRKGAVTG